MSQAEELLNSLSVGNTADTTAEGHIVIGNDRFITVPEELKKIGVQYDHNIETVTFDCPRYWDGLDMSKMVVYINYMLMDGEKGSCLANNIVVDGSNKSIMHFDWTVSRNVTRCNGTITFIVCIKKADSDGNEVNHWNSEICNDIYVSEGLECSEDIIEAYPDIIASLLEISELDTTLTKSNVAADSKAVGDKINYVQSQLDSIVTTGTGNGDAAAEVAQARVDENGNTYLTLKARLDDMVLDRLEISEISPFENKIFSGLTNPTIKDSNLRITNAYPIVFNCNVTIKPKPNIKILIWKIEDGSVVLHDKYTDGIMVSGDCEIESNTAVYITIAYNSNTAISPNDVDDTISIVTTEDQRLITDMDLMYEYSNNLYVNPSDLGTFSHYYYRLDDNNNLVIHLSDLRIMNVFPLRVKSDIIISPNKGYEIIIWDKNEDNSVSINENYADGVMNDNDFVMKSNHSYFIVIKIVGNKNIAPEDIDRAITVKSLNGNKIRKSDFKLRENVYLDFDKTNITFSNIAWTAIDNKWSDRTDIITTNDMIYADRDIIVSPARNLNVRILILTANKYGDITEYTDWTTDEIIVPKHAYFYIEISYKNHNDISPVDAFKRIDIYYYETLQKDIGDISKKLTSVRAIKTKDYLLTNNIISDGFFIRKNDISGRIIEVKNPYNMQFENQYMGQLHCHSWTYGSETEHTRENAENLYNMYKALGYDFMTITNYPYYDDLTPCPVQDGEMIWLCNSFEQGITPTVDDYNQNTHLICLNAKEAYKPEMIIDETVNSVIDHLNSEGTTVVLAHPMWYAQTSYPPTNVQLQTLYTKQQLLNLSDKIKFVEIFNSLSTSKITSPYTENSAYAMDVLASDGRIVYGFAVSDSHVFNNEPDYTMFGGNIKVFANERSRSAIWNSIMEGNFYSCESIYSRLKSIKLIDNTLIIDIGRDATTKFYILDGIIADTVIGSIATYKIKGTETYVRAEIILSDGKRMWTNPIYIN